MKKIMTALLAIATAMTLTMTCFAAEDPAALLERMTAKNSSLDSMDCSMGVHAVIHGENSMIRQNLKMDMAIKLQMDHIRSGALRYKTETATEFMGQTDYSVMFYKDGYYYIDSEDRKVKYQMDLDEIMGKAAESSGVIYPDMEASQMKSMSVREENGLKILSYEADAAVLDQYIQEALGDMLKNMNFAVKIRQITGEYAINSEDYCTSMKMNIIMDMSMEGETITMTMLIEGDVNNPGQPVEVIFPSTNGYQEMEK